MELERIRCTSCGGDIQDFDPQAQTATCPRVGCGATFLIHRAKAFAGLEAERGEELANLRKNLDKAEGNNDPVLMESWAQEILKILPDDPLAAYCGALGQKKRGRYRDYADYLEHAGTMTEWEAGRILDVALREQHYSTHDDDALLAFIRTQFSGDKAAEMQSRLNVAVNRRLAAVNRWADIPRDVFICHSSRNDIALEVYEMLIDDGVKCWISEKNLRPDTRNYWDEIDLAIQKCKIILVIASQQSMLSDDPVREMHMAEDYGLDRLQLKIDDYEQTVYFRHYFDGLQWVKLGEDKEKTFAELKERVYELLHVNDEKEQGQTEEPATRAALNAQPSYLFIHYIDSESSEQYQVERRILNPGKYLATPNLNYTPQGALFGENSEIEVEIGPRGGVQKHISFYFSLPLQPIAVPVCYVAKETGEELGCEERWLDPGERKVIANESLIPGDYRLAEARQQPVSVDRYGATPARVVFQCRLKVPAKNAVVNIRYLSETGSELASEHRELPPGKQSVAPYETVLPDGFKLADASPREVVVGKDGANPSELTFTCTVKIKPVTVEIRYADASGADVARPTKKVLGPGTHKITPSPQGLPANYVPLPPNVRLVTVGENGAVPSKVVFTYSKDIPKLTGWQKFGTVLLAVATIVWMVMMYANQ